jgi:hypothetical protein
VQPVDIAATFAALLGVNQPSAAVGHILTQALKADDDVTYPKPKPTPPVRTHHPAPAPHTANPATKPAAPAAPKATTPKATHP